MKSIKWMGSKNEIELRAECKTTMVDDISDLDGHLINHGQKPQTVANLELWADGKMVDRCTDINFWQIIDLKDGMKKVWGLKVGMTAEQAVKVDEFLRTVIAEGKAPEVAAVETAKKAKEEKEHIERCRETVREAEAQTWIPTSAEYKAWRKQYNDINNEGGEGYIPTMVTREQYEYAKSELTSK